MGVMEPRFNTSFIPKKPVVETASTSGSKSVEQKNIFSIISSTLFVITILAYGGLFAYKIILNNQIKKADSEINDARAAFDTTKIQDLINANSRIVSTKNLLEKHVVVSELLNLLQSLTVKRVRYGTLKYTNIDGLPTVSMTTEAQSYNALAQQLDAFSKSEFVKTPQVSDYNLGDNGNITVKFFANLEPSLVSYKKVIESLSLNQ